jgi:hypothetical protein
MITASVPKRWTFLAVLGALLLSSTAQAEEYCDGEDWFCEEELESDPLASERGSAEPERPKRRPLPEASAERKREPREPVPVIVVDPPRTEPEPVPVIVVDRPENEPEPRTPYRRREWGVKLHLEGALLGDEDEGRHPDAGMGGVGFALRYRPTRHFAFEAGVDLLGGRDYVGNQRREAALLLNALVFFNPRARFQVYALAGLGFSGARVEVLEPAEFDDGSLGDERRYSYFGGQAGIGLEWRAFRKTAFNAELLGFVRERTDEGADRTPEFVDPETHLASNASGGGLFRVGVTFYF